MADGQQRDIEPEEEEDDNSNDGALVNPPRDLINQAREFLGREVSNRELLRAWDHCRDEDSIEAKSHATLLKLLMEPPAPALPAPAPAPAPVAAAAGPSDYRPARDRPPTPGRDGHRDEQRARSSSAAPASDTPKRPAARIYDLTEDLEDERAWARGLDGPSNVKKRLFEPDDADSSVELVASVKKAKKSKAAPTSAREVIDLDSEEEELIRKHAKQKERKDREDKASSSSSGSASASSTDAAKVGQRKRNASTPPTPPPPGQAQAKDLPDAGPVKEEDEEPSLLLKVLAMVPDVDHNHAQNLIDKFSAQQDCLEHVIDALFSDKSYPKAELKASSSRDKGKGRATSEAVESLEDKEKRYMDVKSRAKPGPVYCLAAFDYLDADFPLIPKPYIRTCLNRTVYYAPAHIELKASLDLANPPYNKLHRPRKDKGKGTAYHDDELEVEREFVLTRAALAEAEQAAKAAAEEQEAKEEAAGHVFECGCCFGDYVFSKMVQCPEAHLFCMYCARRNAENAMGNRQTVVSCMDQDGCTVPFTDAECARFLKPNQISLLEKLRSEKALDAAGIAGLAKCPYCPWACVIDNPHERLFRCENEDCLKITCRHCQKADHLPKTCEEHADDLKKNNIHKVEEAMTAAALRKCPKCSQVYIKEYGCNKMMCTDRTCMALSCYLCGELIQGYAHFRDQPLPDGKKNTTSKCVLWDTNEGKNEYDRIEAARKAAIEEVKAMGGEDVQLNEEELAKLAAEKPTHTGYRAHPGQIPRPHIPHGAGGGHAAQMARAAANIHYAVPNGYYALDPLLGHVWVPRQPGAGAAVAAPPAAPAPVPAAPGLPVAAGPVGNPPARVKRHKKHR